MYNEKTLIFDIEKFAVHDGPGIRTVVFMKGCPLHCIWCHNPESQSFRPEIMFNSSKCTVCGNCKSICPEACHIFDRQEHIFDRSKCKNCGRCAEECSSDALLLSGREMSVDQVMDEVMKDAVFYKNSGGGVTLSGGEPLAHFAFTRELLSALKKNNIHTAIETSGFASWENIEKLLELVDLWLWDVKASSQKHKALIGVEFEPIKNNLKKLTDSGAAVILRCPLIPGVNDDEEHLLNIAALSKGLKNIQGIDLEPYHPLGEGKSRQLDRTDVFHADFASETDKTRWQKIISSNTQVPCRIS